MIAWIPSSRVMSGRVGPGWPQLAQTPEGAVTSLAGQSSHPQQPLWANASQVAADPKRAEGSWFQCASEISVVRATHKLRGKSGKQEQGIVRLRPTLRSCWSARLLAPFPPTRSHFGRREGHGANLRIEAMGGQQLGLPFQHVYRGAEGLGQIAGLFMAVSLAPDEHIERIPIGLTQSFHRRGGLGRAAVSGSHHDRPMRRRKNPDPFRAGLVRLFRWNHSWIMFQSRLNSKYFSGPRGSLRTPWHY